MCLRTSTVRDVATPNWDGDRIVQSPVIKAARFVPGTGTRFNIDIREYLSTRDNRLVKEAVEQSVDGLPTSDARSLFWSSRAGSFDHRVRTICGQLSTLISYRRRKDRNMKEWLFPDETLAERAGDCEDHAFLLAAMILASGVSGYVVRIALGKLRDTVTGDATDHAWVMYKNEAGYWLLLDPLLYTVDATKTQPRTARSRKTARGEVSVAESVHEYEPHFVFNDEHLWAVCDRGQSGDLPGYLDNRQFWEEFDPSFAASVHDSIYDQALAGMSWSDLQWVKAASLAIDANLAIYDPRDHFDDAYIPDAWARVEQRLATRSVNDFALAAHAVGDFYAHSSWGVFGQRDAGGKLLPLIDHANANFALAPDYSEDGRFPIASARFSVNEPVWGKRPRSEEPGVWQGVLISGRYAQSKDPHQGVFEKLTYIPGELCDRADYPKRAGLPHHNEIAVDQSTPIGEHRLYGQPAYGEAFQERFGAAVAHIRAIYTAWSKPAAN
jgi:hypothetical protein